MTEIRPEVADGHTVHAPPPLAEARGPIDWLTTADHRRVGQLYVALSLLLGIGALVVGALAGFERIDPGQEIFESSGDQLATLAALALPFLCVVPLLLGLAIAVVPGQVGARTIAFPRAAATSLWVWLSGAGLMIGAYAANGGPGGGDDDGVELFLLALGIVAIGLLLAAICVATTVLTLRVPGLYLDRTPMFSWASMVSAVIMVLTLPVLVGLLVFLYLDQRYSRVVFGGNVGVWPHISWLVRQPTTLMVALPALGIIADVIPVMARTRQQLTGVLYGAIALAGVLSFGAWAQDAIAPDVRDEALFFLVSVVAIAPVLIVLALGGLSLRTGGRPTLGAPLLFSLLGGLMILAGVVNGGLVGLQIFDIENFQLVGTTAEQSQAEYLYLGALVVGLGGVVFWAPKLFGRIIADKAVGGLALLGLLGTVAVALPNVLLGIIEEQPAYVTGGYADGDVTGLNVVSAVGYAVWALVLLAFAGLVLRTVKGDDASDADPWTGHTLEWSSAPPAGPVRSDRPLLDVAEASS